MNHIAKHTGNLIIFVFRHSGFTSIEKAKVLTNLLNEMNHVSQFLLIITMRFAVNALESAMLFIDNLSYRSLLPIEKHFARLY